MPNFEVSLNACPDGVAIPGLLHSLTQVKEYHIEDAFPEDTMHPIIAELRCRK